MTGLGKRITEAREEAKLTKAEFERIIGCSHSLLQAWERGTVKPGVEYLCKIADATDTTTDWLLGRTIKEEA